MNEWVFTYRWFLFGEPVVADLWGVARVRLDDTKKKDDITESKNKQNKKERDKHGMFNLGSRFIRLKITLC